MVQILQAKNIPLRTLIDDFGVQLITDPNFFWEWRGGLPEISGVGKRYLHRVVDRFVNLLEYPLLLEGVIRMTVVDPLLFCRSSRGW